MNSDYKIAQAYSMKWLHLCLRFWGLLFSNKIYLAYFLVKHLSIYNTLSSTKKWSTKICLYDCWLFESSCPLRIVLPVLCSVYIRKNTVLLSKTLSRTKTTPSSIVFIDIFLWFCVVDLSLKYRTRKAYFPRES